MSSAHALPNTVLAPDQITVAQTLSEPERESMVSLLRLLPADCIELNSNTVDDVFTTLINSSEVHIKNMVDGRGLACPMPLLKTKVALRNVAIGESLYIVATDPNSQADITAFCQQTQQQSRQADASNLLLRVNQTTNKDTRQNTQQNSDQSSADTAAVSAFDTIYHFIITKTDSN